MAMVRSKQSISPVAFDERDLPAVESLSRPHVSRLKWYFMHASRSAAALPDNIDLDLSVAGFIQRVHMQLSGVVLYAITPKGEAMVAAIRNHARASRAPHHDLGRHLAQWLSEQGRLTWEDCAFDVAVNGAQATTRPDVFSTACTLNLAKLDAHVHEIKVSRSDFLSDIKQPDKREAYFQLAPRVSYATPFGLVSKEEIPAECGWIEQGQGGALWIVRKRAPKRKPFTPWTDRMWMTLVLRSHPGLKGLAVDADTL